MKDGDIIRRPMGEYTTKFLYSDNPDRTIILDSSKFDILNQSSVEDGGETLSLLAERDANHAYDCLRHALGSSAANGTLDMIEDGLIVTDASLEGNVTSRKIAEELVYRLLPPIFEGSRTVHVKCFPTAGDREIGLSDLFEVMTLHITPERL